MKVQNELSSNRAIRECMADEIPVSVLRQLSPKPNVRYQVLGLARILGKASGYYLLEGARSESMPSAEFKAPFVYPLDSAGVLM